MHKHSEIYQKYKQISQQIYTFLDYFLMPWEILYFVTRWKHCVRDCVFLCNDSENAMRLLVIVRVEMPELFRSLTKHKNAIVALLYIGKMSSLLVLWTRWGIKVAVWHWLRMKAMSDLFFLDRKDTSESKLLILSTATFQLNPWLLLSITSALIVLAFYFERLYCLDTNTVFLLNLICQNGTKLLSWVQFLRPRTWSLYNKLYRLQIFQRL